MVCSLNHRRSECFIDPALDILQDISAIDTPPRRSGAQQTAAAAWVRTDAAVLSDLSPAPGRKQNL